MSKRMASRHLPALTLSRIATAVQLALITGLTVGALGVAAPPAFAQAAQARQAFSVPAGSLGMALNTFAAEAGIELTAEANLLQGKSSAGLSGSYSVPEGFYELLRGHGLQAVREGNGSYTVRREPAHSAAADAAATMPAEAKSSFMDSTTCSVSRTPAAAWGMRANMATMSSLRTGATARTSR